MSNRKHQEDIKFSKDILSYNHERAYNFLRNFYSTQFDGSIFLSNLIKNKSDKNTIMDMLYITSNRMRYISQESIAESDFACIVSTLLISGSILLRRFMC